MTLQNNRAPLLCYFKLSASFRSHWWIKTWVTVRKRPIWVKFGAMWPWNLTDDLAKQKGTSVCYFKLCASFCSHWWIKTWVTVRKRPIWVKFDEILGPCDLEIWRMTLQNKTAPLLCYFKLCASFCSHWWIKTWVTVRKRPIWVKLNNF